MRILSRLKLSTFYYDILICQLSGKLFAIHTNTLRINAVHAHLQILLLIYLFIYIGGFDLL